MDWLLAIWAGCLVWPQLASQLVSQGEPARLGVLASREKRLGLARSRLASRSEPEPAREPRAFFLALIDSDTIQLESDLTYPEHPIKILDRKDRITRRTTIRFYKVQWSNHLEDEATWEQEGFLKAKYPDFLSTHQGTSHLNLLVFYFLLCLNLGRRLL